MSSPSLAGGGSPKGHRRFSLSLVAVPSVVALLAHLALVWCFDLFPTVDGPAHVHLVHAFQQALSGDEFYRTFVELSRGFKPNLASQLILFSLMWVVPPLVAEKLFLSAYFAGFALGGGYALRALHPAALFLLPLLMFTSFTFPLAFGFYNFSLSAVVLFTWFGYSWRRRGAESGGRLAAGHLVFATVACVTHVFALAAGLAVVAGTLVVHALVARDEEGARRSFAQTISAHLVACWRPVWPVLVGSAPALIAAGAFLLDRRGANRISGDVAGALIELGRLEELAYASSLVAYARTELAASSAFVVLLLASFLLILRSGATWRRALPVAAAGGFFVVLYLFVPPLFVVRWMPPRIQPLAYGWIVLWLAALLPPGSPRRRWRFVVPWSGAGLVVLATVLRWGSIADVNAVYHEIASVAPAVDKHSTLISLRLHPPVRGRPYSARVDPLIQVGSRIATLTSSIDLRNFQGQSMSHPIRLRSGVGATRLLGGSDDLLIADARLNAVPPRVDLATYERETGVDVDYVVVWGFREWFEPSLLLALDRQLEAGYELTLRSQPRGLATLYRRRDR
ncbi:MAG TPA: hypothetical protein VMT85_21150 [Thermoanaerobaculia bacterium]|nr:hypothetical protein [Thermoanaerobaculia bacterium]